LASNLKDGNHMPIYKSNNSLTPKIATRKCSYCDLRLEENMNTDELYDKYRGEFYHKGCKKLADEYTDNVPGALADILRRTKRSVRESQYDYDLGSNDIEAMRFLMDLWEKQDGICPGTGLEMRCDTDHEFTFHLKPSLDRRENDGGYTKDNVQLTTQLYNLLKSDLTTEQTVMFCQAVIDTAKLKKPATRKRTARVVASSSKPAKPKANSRGRRAAL
jgi:hypothetical protein